MGVQHGNIRPSCHFPLFITTACCFRQRVTFVAQRFTNNGHRLRDQENDKQKPLKLSFEFSASRRTTGSTPRKKSPPEFVRQVSTYFTYIWNYPSSYVLSTNRNTGFTATHKCTAVPPYHRSSALHSSSRGPRVKITPRASIHFYKLPLSRWIFAFPSHHPEIENCHN